MAEYCWSTGRRLAPAVYRTGERQYRFWSLGGWTESDSEGLKGHELLLDVLDIVCRQDPKVWGVLAGGTFAGDRGYERALRRRAARLGGGRILMPGPVPATAVPDAWRAFDCVLHLPLSENCGGVVEPLAAGVPVVAAAVGGLPEVVLDGRTGRLVRKRDAETIASTVADVLAEPETHRALASLGSRLVREMFDVARTAAEVKQIYEHVVTRNTTCPEAFDPERSLAGLNRAR